ncbi:LysR family transcriptional regulator [Ottowia sp.]|uniref:LysR family transcriptional regulator n=1 Tax=Ottowia sp. TaxID=1898956 RepID=UPI003A86DF20
MEPFDPARLPSLAWFAYIARHGSFTRAAAEMGVSRAALSQKLKALERQLGVKLLQRTTRDMALTEEGQRLYTQLRPALQSIAQAVRGLGDARAEPAGLLRINNSRVAAHFVIEPHLAEFLARYPLLRLVLDDGLSNIVADGVDAGIRLGESLAPHMVAVPLTPRQELAVVGAPAYLARRGVPTTPAELMQHDCVAYRHASSGAIFQWAFRHPDAGGIGLAVAPQGTLVLNDTEAMVRAALHGLGLVQMLEIAVRPRMCRRASWCACWCPGARRLPAFTCTCPRARRCRRGCGRWWIFWSKSSGARRSAKAEEVVSEGWVPAQVGWLGAAAVGQALARQGCKVVAAGGDFSTQAPHRPVKWRATMGTCTVFR